MNTIRPEQLLEQIRAMSPGLQPESVQTPQTDRPEFGDVLQNTLKAVNEAQKESGDLAARFEAGDPGTSLVDVMLARQKSGLAFQAVTEVRNKLVSAYQDIMNMPV